MENINLLDLNNDILNIIGDYVKKDNVNRIVKEEKEIFKQVDIKMKINNGSQFPLHTSCVILRSQKVPQNT